MLLRRIETAPAFSRFFEDILDREMYGNTPKQACYGATIPAVNITEKEDSFTIEMAAPGLAKEDFKISLKENTLTIATEKSEANEQNEKTYTRKEYSYQSFSRSFTLPEKSVDVDSISAKYENGELQITILKKEEAKSKEPKAIEVK